MKRLSGLVTKVVGTSSYVETEEGAFHCDLRAKLFRRQKVRLAVGDRVEFEVTEAPPEGEDQAGEPGRGVIDAVAERRSVLRRTRDFKRDQIVCANIDRVFLVVAAFDPPYKRAFMDRVIVGIERDDLEPVLVINKMDLTDEAYREVVVEDAEIYRRLGYLALLVSATTGEGMDDLREAFQKGISAVVGPSGVGKSSLLNRLCPGLTLRTGEVSTQKEGRGRHTTTAAELVRIPGAEGYVVDTPGLRAFGLWDATPDDILHGFREIAALAPGCRFSDCGHKTEPKCAVRAAVEEGKVDGERFDSFLNLKDEIETQAAQRQASRRR